jgi:Zn-dependent membrane protease YugP
MLAAWTPLFVALSPSFVLGLAAALAQQRAQAALEARPVPAPEAAGPWTQAAAARAGLATDVGLHPDKGAQADGYWPGVDFVALSQRTWRRADALAWAVGAHELGHAANVASHRWMGTLLPMARVAEVQAAHAMGAFLLVGALTGSGMALGLAGVAGLGAALASVAVLADELFASRRGLAMMQSDGRLSGEAIASARASTHWAASVYAAQALGRLLSLVALPWAAEAVLSAPPAPPAWLAAPGWWWFVALGPVLVLRAAQVLDNLLRHRPVRSEFRLAQETNLEHQWDFLAGMSVAILVLVFHPVSEAPAWRAAMMLAAIPAMGPVGALGRLPVLLPVVAALALGQRGRASTPSWAGEEPPSGASPVPAPVLAWHNDPPAWWRGLAALKLSFLPLLLALGVLRLG